MGNLLYTNINNQLLSHPVYSGFAQGERFEVVNTAVQKTANYFFNKGRDGFYRTSNLPSPGVISNAQSNIIELHATFNSSFGSSISTFFLPFGLSNSTTNFSNSSDIFRFLLRYGGTITNMDVSLYRKTAGVVNYTFTSRLNGVDTLQSVLLNVNGVGHYSGQSVISVPFVDLDQFSFKGVISSATTNPQMVLAITWTVALNSPN